MIEIIWRTENDTATMCFWCADDAVARVDNVPLCYNHAEEI